MHDRAGNNPAALLAPWQVHKPVRMSTASRFARMLIRHAPLRMAQLAGGVMLMVAGPLIGLIPSPLPFGLLLFGIGLALVLRNSLWARRRYVRWKRRYPRAGRITDFGLRRRRGKVRAALKEK